MATKIQLVFDCADPGSQARFWAHALRYKEQDPPPGFATWQDFLTAQGVPEERWNDASAIVDPEGQGPRVFFQRVPEGKIAKNRMHMDLTVTTRGAPIEQRRTEVNAEVARLKTLGASDHRGAIEKPEFGEYWVRMNDPEGNEFCVQ